MCPVQKRSFRLLINKFRIFLPAPTLPALNNKLAGFEPVLDESGKIIGYKTDVGGADTVFPFNGVGYPDSIAIFDSRIYVNNFNNYTAQLYFYFFSTVYKYIFIESSGVNTTDNTIKINNVTYPHNTKIKISVLKDVNLITITNPVQGSTRGMMLKITLYKDS